VTHLVVDAVRLTADPGLSWQPAISQDGHLVVFSSDRANENNLDLWVKQADGGDPVRLTNDAADEVEPDFCPDGRGRIPFGGSSGRSLHCSCAGRITEFCWRPMAETRKCSPDGSAVAFWTGTPSGAESNRLHLTGGIAVYTVSTSGGEPVRRAPELDRCLRPCGRPTAKHYLSLDIRARVLPGIKRSGSLSLSAPVRCEK
jgi:hypothetical protein